jgi:hypothetical protein
MQAFIAPKAATRQSEKSEAGENAAPISAGVAYRRR